MPFGRCGGDGLTAAQRQRRPCHLGSPMCRTLDASSVREFIGLPDLTV